MASAPSTPTKSARLVADGKRKASRTPEAPDSERFDDPQKLQNASKLQYWFVVMMHDAAMLHLLGGMLEGSVSLKSKFGDVRDLMTHSDMDNEERGNAALKLLQWSSSCEDEPHASFGLKGHEHLFNYGEVSKMGNEALFQFADRFLKECAERRELLLKVADVCAARAPPRQYTDQQSSAAGKPAKKAKIEREDIYQTPKPQTGLAKSVKINEIKLQFKIKNWKSDLANCFKRMQLLLLARLMAASLCNSALELSSSASSSGKTSVSENEKKTIGHPDIDAIFPSSERKSSVYDFTVANAERVLKVLVPDTDNAFEPFADIGGKKVALDVIDEMCSINHTESEWRPEKKFGDRLFESVLNMVCGLPVLDPDELSCPPDLSEQESESEQELR